MREKDKNDENWDSYQSKNFSAEEFIENFWSDSSETGKNDEKIINKQLSRQKSDLKNDLTNCNRIENGQFSGFKKRENSKLTSEITDNRASFKSVLQVAIFFRFYRAYMF